MKTRRRVLTLALAAAMGLILPGGSSCGEEESSPVSDSREVLEIDVQSVLLPYVDELMLSRGSVATSSLPGSYALKISVRPESAQGWKLWIRAVEPYFSSSDVGKPCTDLYWKQDDESTSAYRPVTTQETVIFECPGGGNAEVHLDLKTSLDWATSPGEYRLDLAFHLQYLE